ncbi:hypothetical protein GCM10009862_06640 [Microbacterium binotii]|uniref:Uncharacterized protein n=2 Tax=Microbacterium binotii TaxID=462710 RepID=A0ABP6BKC6_9MICO
MLATIDSAEAPFLGMMLHSMPALVTTDEVLAAAEAAELCLDVRGVPEAQRPGHRFTFEAADAVITVERTVSGWALDAVEEVQP